MNNRNLTVLGVLAVLMIVWAVIQSNISNRSVTSRIESETYLIQGLNLDKIASIVIVKDEKSLKLKRSGSGFVVPENDDYPAQAKKINELITEMLDIKIREFITDNPDNYTELEVADDKARGIVKFFDADGEIITGVLIGTYSELGGSYVRLASGKEVYAAGSTPSISNSGISYINQDILQLKEDDIDRVTVTNGNKSYTLKRDPETSKITLAENIIVPENKKLKESDIKQIFTALTSLSLDDVKKASELKDKTFRSKYICRMKDSTVYTIAISKNDDKNFIKCRAEFTSPGEITKEERIESEEELKKKEAKLLARDRANEFNERRDGWAYEISSLKAGNLTKDLEDLFENKEEKKEEKK